MKRQQLLETITKNIYVDFRIHVFFYSVSRYIWRIAEYAEGTWEPTVRATRFHSPFFAEFCRLCMLSGGTQRRS